VDDRKREMLVLRCIGFENVCDAGDHQASDKSKIKNILPALFHVLLTGLNAEKIAGRGIIVISVICCIQVTSSRERLGGLRSS
jgi:hypothetical protein